MSVENTSLDYEQMDRIFERANSIFFIGIGGVSMSALADFCARCGKRVFGYDCARSEFSACLEKSCFIKYCSTPDSVDGMELVIYSTAIDEGNLELRRARELKIPTVSRANFLGYVMSRHKSRIAICGTHGKSTTTAMLGHIYLNAGHDPSVFCGAHMIDSGGTHVIGSGDFIVEACEYKNAFLSLCPTQAGITNIDFDHPDFFKSEEQIIDSFQKFVNMAEKIYLNSDSALCQKVKHSKKITYGIDKKADYTAKIAHRSGKNGFTVFLYGTELASCSLPFFGKHFVYDALCAFCIAHQNGISPSSIVQALSTFSGTKRRMELIKSDTYRHFFEDYAHHPSEIRASLEALKESGFKRILCVFQPHTYSRSYYLQREFASCFFSADSLVILPTYGARTENDFGLCDKDFATLCGGIYAPDALCALSLIDKSSCDAVVLMGAGDLCGLRALV